jgi:hypothetical protein
VRRDELQRDRAPHPQVLREIDDAHAAARQQLLQAVVAELGADRWLAAHRH